jgi:cell division protein FtsB
MIMAKGSETIRLIKKFPMFADKYKYVLLACLYLMYMSFFDQYKIPVVFSLSTTVRDMQDEKLSFEKLIVQAKEDKMDIEKNYEKFAREKYFMSKQDEDVYIIEKRSLKKR